jgi:hypothetical protein
MVARQILQVPVWLLAGYGALLNAQPPAAPSMDKVVGITAVCSRVSKDYVRTKLPDGSFQPEEYALGKGGRLDGSFRDPSFDNSRFIDIARAVTGPLAAQNYRPAKKPDTEKLLIMVYWGTTIVPDPMSMSPAWTGLNNEIGPKTDVQQLGQLYTDDIMRNQIDKKNAMVLGYDSDGSAGSDGISAALHRGELRAELEDSRYYVVLLAFDFQAFRTEKKHKLLWETRFSIQEARNLFDKALPVMTQYASAYFGQDSHGLVRTKVPEGKVLIGEPRSLGEVEEPQK